MLSKYFFLLLWASFLYAYDFSHCQKYYDLASRPGSVSLFWEGKQVAFVHGSVPKGVKILKADPFVGFYLIKVPPTKFAYNLLDIDEQAYKHPLASIGSHDARPGSILARQRGFLIYARFSAPMPANAVVSNICYQIYGIGVGNKENAFIESRYIKRFLSQNSPYYGDIGVRVKEQGGVMVESVDPFFTNNPFLEKDVITKINNQPITSTGHFEWLVSNLPFKRVISVQIRRKGQLQTLTVRVDKRYGGFLLPDSFLERFIKINAHFVITALHKNRPQALRNLHLGDQILWINRKPIASSSANFTQKLRALRQAFSHAYMQGRIEMLILRKGFEFYVRL
ncbi:DUF7488 domain-containing protein [Helicobacter suis]|uniref:DUF7488 domain-containing protein n=1 Tax=Helicobacter suis TaxID=104628 RepID=UPI00196867C6|nr:PDZ domain-containing protein [Helicobacter suis]